MRRQRCAAGSGKTQAADRARPYCAIICRSVVGPLSEPERSFIDRLPELVGSSAAGGFMATWRSGYAAVCKTVYPGSIPGVASNKIKRLEPSSESVFGAPRIRWQTFVSLAGSWPRLPLHQRRENSPGSTRSGATPNVRRGLRHMSRLMCNVAHSSTQRETVRVPVQRCGDGRTCQRPSVARMSFRESRVSSRCRDRKEKAPADGTGANP
jgi:hypothetical protein